MPRPALLLLRLLPCLLLAGCAASTTLAGKHGLDVQTKMSATVFLEPVAPGQRAVLVQVRNSSDQAAFDLQAGVEAALRAKGYRLVDDPAQAQYLLQANVLQVGRSSPSAAEQTFKSGFGGALFGGAVGALGTRAASKDSGAIIAGGLLGAAAEAVTGSAVRDVTYTIVTDLQVAERAIAGVSITESLEQDLGQGTGGVRVLRTSEITDWKRYQTRIVSTANRVNLPFEAAAPALADGLTRSIAGMF
jgi:hypothetical protein